MTAPAELPADPGVADFDRLHDDPARWIGTVLVLLLGRELVLELEPPFLREHFAFKRALPSRLQGRLSLPTPRLADGAKHAGWPCLAMTRLPGTAPDRRPPDRLRRRAEAGPGQGRARCRAGRAAHLATMARSPARRPDAASTTTMTDSRVHAPQPVGPASAWRRSP